MRSGVSNRNKFLREIHCADCPEVYRLDKDTRIETISCPNCGGRRGMYVDQNGIPYRRTVDNNDWFFNLDGSPNDMPREILEHESLEALRRDRERLPREFGFAPAVSDRPNLANYPGAGST